VYFLSVKINFTAIIKQQRPLKIFFKENFIVTSSPQVLILELRTECRESLVGLTKLKPEIAKKVISAIHIIRESP